MSEIVLRGWQKEADEDFSQRVRDGISEYGYLCAATPGAGKTLFSVKLALDALRSGAVRRVFVAVPTCNLKRQWHQKFELHSGNKLRVVSDWSGSALPTDCSVVTLTYAQCASSTLALNAILSGKDMLIADEIHHAGTSRAYGNGLLPFRDAIKLLLSGTPFRSDNNPIPFVRYENNQSIMDFEYPYGKALAHGHVRPVYFEHCDAQVRLADGEREWEESLSDGTPGVLGRALDPRLRFCRERIADADARLREIRKSDPSAGGIIFARDVTHAHSLAKLLPGAVVVASKDPDSGELDKSAARRLDEFRHGTAPWLVSVKMVSEGVDVPRLRVGVYLTNTTTATFFMQALGRILRVRPGEARGTPAYLYMPDDPDLHQHAMSVKVMREDNLRIEEEKATEPGDGSDREPSNVTALSADPSGKYSVLYERVFENEHAKRVREYITARGFNETPELFLSVADLLGDAGEAVGDDSEQREANRSPADLAKFLREEIENISNRTAASEAKRRGSKPDYRGTRVRIKKASGVFKPPQECSIAELQKLKIYALEIWEKERAAARDSGA